MYGTGFRSDLKNRKYITYMSDHTLQYYLNLINENLFSIFLPFKIYNYETFFIIIIIISKNQIG